MNPKICVALVVVGMISLGITPLESYVAPGLPYVLLPLLAASSGFLATTVSLSFHGAAIALAVAAVAPRYKKPFLLGAATLVLISVSFVTCIGTQSSAVCLRLLTSLLILIPSLLYIALRSERCVVAEA